MTAVAALLGAFSLAALGCGEKTGTEATPTSAEASSASPAAPTGAAPTDTAAAAPTDAAPAGTTTPAAAVSIAAPAAPPSGTAAAGAPTSQAATPAGTGSAAAGEKTFDCGAKGQKACPMQGWMKSVMGSAASSGDGEKLAKALSYVAGKAPPGMGSWSGIAADGAAKAKAGDIDGAKQSCKKCHDLYKNRYVKTMRDAPW